MNITVINGTMRKGSTYHLTQLFLDAIKDENTKITEFFLPRDLDSFCAGCYNCILNGEEKCPHYSQTAPIAQALEQADLIIVQSPVYVFNMSGQLKTFMDHFAYQWISHRPDKTMFNKVGLVITTAAGAGDKKAAKAIKTNLEYWGIPRVYLYHKKVMAMRWDDVADKRKSKYEKELKALADSIKAEMGHVKPTLKSKFMFNIMKLNQKSNNWNMTDKAYWQKNGWID